MRISIQISLEHPIMFLADPYADEHVPPDAGNLIITSTDDCVSFRVKPYVDGRASITISTERPSECTAPAFTGSIVCDSDTLSLSDSHRFNYCLVPVKDGKADVEIWRGLEDEDDIWIRVSNLVEY